MKPQVKPTEKVDYASWSVGAKVFFTPVDSGIYDLPLMPGLREEFDTAKVFGTVTRIEDDIADVQVDDSTDVIKVDIANERAFRGCGYDDHYVVPFIKLKGESDDVTP